MKHYRSTVGHCKRVRIDVTGLANPSVTKNGVVKCQVLALRCKRTQRLQTSKHGVVSALTKLCVCTGCGPSARHVVTHPTQTKHVTRAISSAADDLLPRGNLTATDCHTYPVCGVLQSSMTVPKATICRLHGYTHIMRRDRIYLVTRYRVHSHSRPEHSHGNVVASNPCLCILEVISSTCNSSGIFVFA